MNDNQLYLCFSASFDQEAARKRFVDRYKQQPEKVFTKANLLWVGPVPKRLEAAPIRARLAAIEKEREIA